MIKDLTTKLKSYTKDADGVLAVLLVIAAFTLVLGICFGVLSLMALAIKVVYEFARGNPMSWPVAYCSALLLNAVLGIFRRSKS